MKHITILGATGSIGINTLDVLSRQSDWQVFALSAFSQVDKLAELCLAHRPRYAWLGSAENAAELTQMLRSQGCKTEVLHSPDDLCRLCDAPEVDAVMAAIVGAAGLPPSLAAAKAGKRLLLANKEALVVGGDLFMQAVRDNGAQLLPIDSEHSAIFQSLPDDPARWQTDVEKIILTASGGPFRQRDPATLASVTPEEAVAHPNWVMGRKISVDSASMMNKALEVIEAHYLFGFAPEQIEVVIHPQSIIHSMVQYRDASIVAQLGTPDMRVPIALGLSWPGRTASGAAALDFKKLQAMSFEEADALRFPGLQLAWAALKAAPGSTCVLNAANEVAVEAFLNRQIAFDQIYQLNRATLEGLPPGRIASVEDLLALDAQSRAYAREQLLKLAKS
jgi:1-deoxy-D-xylulose-5-phosphate reductoisomerase